MHPTALHRLRQLDRADLAVFLVAVNGASNSLKRDECGDPVIVGTRGNIRASNIRFSVYVACRSSKHWRHVKQALAGFCVVTQDGEDEGVLQLTRRPVGKESERLRAVVGLRQTRPRPPFAFRPDTKARNARNARLNPRGAV